MKMVSVALVLIIVVFCSGYGQNASEQMALPINKIMYRPPHDGIKYSYFYFIPNTALKETPIRVLLYAHSVTCQTVCNNSKFPCKISYETAYSRVVQYVRTKEIPRILPYIYKYRYILLIVVLPRNCNPYPELLMYTVCMPRWVMFPEPKVANTKDYWFYERPDLEIVKVIDEFITFLRKQNLDVYSKVFIAGFSCGGVQANRIAILHPNKVAAVAIGAPGAFLYPAKTWKGFSLPYPLGVADIDQLSETSFSLEDYTKIPHFIFVGEKDTARINDPVNFEACYAKRHARIIKAYFGRTPPERAKIFAQYLESLEMDVSLKIYRGIGHEMIPEMIYDIFSFFSSVHLEDIDK